LKLESRRKRPGLSPIRSALERGNAANLESIVVWTVHNGKRRASNWGEVVRKNRSSGIGQVEFAKVIGEGAWALVVGGCGGIMRKEEKGGSDGGLHGGGGENFETGWP
jgi:hypothetical protein